MDLVLKINSLAKSRVAQLALFSVSNKDTQGSNPSSHYHYQVIKKIIKKKKSLLSFLYACFGPL